jgi:hypothetical protein
MRSSSAMNAAASNSGSITSLASAKSGPSGRDAKAEPGSRLGFQHRAGTEHAEVQCARASTVPVIPHRDDRRSGIVRAGPCWWTWRVKSNGRHPLPTGRLRLRSNRINQGRSTSMGNRLSSSMELGAIRGYRRTAAPEASPLTRGRNAESYHGLNRWAVTQTRNPPQASEISDPDVTISTGKRRRCFGLDTASGGRTIAGPASAALENVVLTASPMA